MKNKPERATVMFPWGDIIDALREKYPDRWPAWQSEGFGYYKNSYADENGLTIFPERLPEHRRPQR